MQIETDRLELRPFADADLDALAALLADPAFMAFSIEGPMDCDQAEARLASLRACQAQNGYSKLAVISKSSGELVGYCGLESEVIDGRVEPELGFRIAARHRGQGLATEAARGVIDDAFGRLGLPRLYAFVEPANKPSRQVLAKLGMTDEGREIALKGRNYLLFRLDNAP